LIHNYRDEKTTIEEVSAFDARRDFDKQLCLHYPIVLGNIPMIKNLIEEASVNVNAKYFWLDVVEGEDRHKANAGWMSRARWSFLDVLANSYLYGGGTQQQRTFLRPLITAITSESAHCVSVVRLLLEYGADPSLGDDAGKSPMEYALDLQVDEQTKSQLIFLLRAHEKTPASSSRARSL
jgi:hypothetical protein